MNAQNAVPGSPESRRNARTITRNFVVLTVGQIISRALAVVSNVYLARVLGAEYFGVVAFALTVLTYPELIVNAGFLRLGPREIVRDPSRDNVHTLVRAVITMRLVLSFVAFGIFTAITLVLPETTPFEQRATFIYGFALFLMVIDVGWVFFGTEQMGWVSMADIAMQVVTVIGTFLLIQRPEDLPRVGLIYLAAQAVSIGGLFALYIRRYGMTGLGVEARVWRPLARAALPLAVTRGMATLNLNFDSLLVGLVMSSYATGQYGAAYRFIWVPALLLAIYFSALTPYFDRAYKAGVETIRAVLDRSIRVTGALGIGIAVGGVMTAPAAFEFVYGAEYHDAVLPFQILVLSVAFMFINRNYRVLLVSFEQQNAQLKLIMIAAAANVLLNVLLLPRYGLPGAALATVVSEALTLVTSYAYVHRLIAHVGFGRHLPRMAAAAGVLALTLLALHSAHVVIQVMIGAAVYGAAMLAFGIVHPQEIVRVVRAWLPTRVSADAL
jgi:O-antigen/teichoic acid export membrane protein